MRVHGVTGSAINKMINGKQN